MSYWHAHAWWNTNACSMSGYQYTKGVWHPDTPMADCMWWNHNAAVPIGVSYHWDDDSTQWYHVIPSSATVGVPWLVTLAMPHYYCDALLVDMVWLLSTVWIEQPYMSYTKRCMT